MMFTTVSLVVLALSAAVVVLSNIGFGREQRELPEKMHRVICISVFILGCFLRLFDLGSLPGGISAEEALVGMQAKALWQTGGFLFHDGLSAQLSQWTGESSGPLLMLLTAPFVGIFGMTRWTVRLTLALLSCAAIPAAYGLGDALAGKKAGRWMLVIYALCPYFVLSARLTCSANAAVCLLPAALYAMIRGLKKPAYAYIGAVMMALMAYVQNMYFFIAPAVIVSAAVIGVIYGMKKQHALGAAAMGLLICVPAVLTLWVNLCGGQTFKWLGIVEIPLLENFDKADSLLGSLKPGEEHVQIQDKIWAIIAGGIFQLVEHMNISPEMYAPTGMGMLYIVSLPLMPLGALVLIQRVFSEKMPDDRQRAGWVLVVVSFVITLVALIHYGSEGALDLTGCTDVFDYSSLLVFDALLMAAGLYRLEKKSRKGIAAMSGLLCVCVAMLCVHLFGPGYRENSNVYFKGFEEACVEAKRIQEETNAVIGITDTVYPHITPSDAAEWMYLYAIDADVDEVSDMRGKLYEIIYAPGMEEADKKQMYIVTESDISAWDLSGFHYEEMGDYVLLSPAEM